MKIHIISTANGQQNEGMRNVATHLIKELSKKHEVHTSGLKSIASILKNSLTCDATIFCAKLNGTTYSVLKLITVLSKHVHAIVVQQPEQSFLEKNDRAPLKCSYFTLCMEDMEKVKLQKGYTVSLFEAGINAEKFSPVSQEERIALKQKYGITTEKPLVIHVGHCSQGRGLEDFCTIDSEKFERLIITSGMFESEEINQKLVDAGITRLTGYIETVQDYYRMADAYLFPTKSGEFVISVPLSVMEALSCGTAAVAYRSFEKIKNIRGAEEGLLFIDDVSQLNETLQKAVAMKKDTSYLTEPKTWADVADEIYEKIKNK